jgi:hypothetical protein
VGSQMTTTLSLRWRLLQGGQRGSSSLLRR